MRLSTLFLSLSWLFAFLAGLFSWLHGRQEQKDAEKKDDERARKIVEDQEWNLFKQQITYPVTLVAAPVREVEFWFRKVRAAGLPIPHDKIVEININPSPHPTPYGGPNYSLTDGRHIITCEKALVPHGEWREGVWYPNIEVWRGLTAALLGKPMIEVNNPDEAFVDDMMYKAFGTMSYVRATPEQQEAYWSNMLQIDQFQ